MDLEELYFFVVQITNVAVYQMVHNILNPNCLLFLPIQCELNIAVLLKVSITLSSESIQYRGV
jgi:hypothetical protein